MIEGLLDVNNIQVKELEENKEEVKVYFHNLFISTNPSPNILEVILEGITLKVTEDMKKQLDKGYTKEKICNVLLQMYPCKALGSDELNVGFFQKYQNIINEWIVTVCFNILMMRKVFHL